ncbi:hypothetical protein [Chlorobium phaeobacteroides]|uniref:ATP-binding protein n=1 Tax=Chlorobium phaeobacteroides (strain DSM 266 / SMG 266 / 2430) TaxID=290317 RepID=A1BI51_CHLPD|nr:hypothetical protein [Chlorobium phaeobacteroides]ABL66078.1 conserved hypothetical protein [Chlorobium phaeobacteroides DSM 266]
MTSIIDEIRAEVLKPAEKFSSGGVFEQTDVHYVHHVHQSETDEQELERCVTVVEDVVRRGKDEPGLYGSDAFRAAWTHICKSSDEQRFRLRVKIKENKPIGVPLGEIDRVGSGGEGGEDRSAADELVSLAVGAGELFFDETTRDGFVTVGSDTMRVRSVAFLDWLSYRHYRESGGSSASDSALKQACGTLSGLCQHEGKPERVFLRAGRNSETGAYYLHGIGKNGQSAEVTATGWRLLEVAPVKFWRSGSAVPFPEPIAGGDIGKLWDLVNIPEADRVLVLAWILEAWRPDTPFPALELCGVQGSAKSSTQKRLRMLVDASSAPLRAAPKTVEDAFVSAGNNWVVSLDNVSHLSAGLQDAFCIMATDGAYAGRTLFTNADETVITIKRPVVLSGINNPVTAQDLISRTVHIELPVIEGRRRLESELDAAFNEAWPEIFGGLLDLFVKTLRMLPETVLPVDALRMADFNHLGEAMARAMGYKPGAFTSLYRGNYRESVQRAMESSPVAVAVAQMAEDSPLQEVFDGTYKELLEKLVTHKTDNEGWPKSEKGLANALKRQMPALQEIGVVLIPETGPKQSKKGRRIVIRKGEHGEHSEHGNVQKAPEEKKYPIGCGSDGSDGSNDPCEPTGTSDDMPF